MREEELRYPKIIQDWFSLANGNNIDSSDVFFRFVAAWVGFNAFYTYHYSRRNKSGRINDGQLVKKCAEHADLITNHVWLIDNDSKYLNAVHILKEKGVWDTQNREISYISSTRDLSEVLNCVYRVRCNLFHGGKIPTDVRDKTLVEAAHVITSRTVECIIDVLLRE
jgi:hypothetical protein